MLLGLFLDDGSCHVSKVSIKNCFVLTIRKIPWAERLPQSLSYSNYLFKYHIPKRKYRTFSYEDGNSLLVSCPLPLCTQVLLIIPLVFFMHRTWPLHRAIADSSRHPPYFI